jgi:4-diphosphocytidyl-2C-methyl-D-erythritol kinase
MKVWLLAQPEVEAAMMSGSGSTMIAFLDHQYADAVIERAHTELDPSLWASKAAIL